jgi:hypothetical protein
MSLPPIVAKVTADTTELVKGLGNAERRLATFAKVGGAAALAVGTAMVALTKRSLAEVDAQAKLAQSLRTTVGSMQTLSRAGQLAGVSMGGIQQATSDLTRRLSQAAAGTGPAAEALKRLGLSASELAAVPLDQRIMKINEALDQFIPSTERAAVAGQLFGEEGSLAMARIDTATLRQATADVQRFGVVVSEQDADNIESANDAVSRLGLVMQGLGNQMAANVAPALERVANGIATFVARVAGFKVELQEFFGTLEMARASLGEDLFQELIGNPEMIRRNGEALATIAEEVASIATIAATAAPQLRIFADELEDIDPEGTRLARIELKALANSIEEADQALANNIITQEQYNAEVADTIIRAQAIVTEFANINGADFSNAFANIQALGERLRATAAAAEMARKNIAAAVFEQSPAGQALAQYGGRGTTSDRPILLTGPGVFMPDPNAPTMRPEQPGVDSDIFGLGDTGGGVGSGVADQMAERERMEQEHQDRLNAIRALGNEGAVSMTLGAGQEILNAMGQTNEKALRIAKVFSAAQALISTYQGAAEALKLPFPKNLAAAASVIAKGIGFVNAIKGVSKGGGGAVGAGGGAGAAAAGPAGGGVSQNVAIQLVGGDMFNRSQVVTLINKINEAVEGGAKLRIV